MSMIAQVNLGFTIESIDIVLTSEFTTCELFSAMEKLKEYCKVISLMLDEQQRNTSNSLLATLRGDDDEATRYYELEKKGYDKWSCVWDEITLLKFDRENPLMIIVGMSNIQNHFPIF